MPRAGREGALTWKPRRTAATEQSLRLDAEAGFVLAQIDGETDLETLCDVTGLAPEVVGEIVERLVACGAVARDHDAPPVQLVAETRAAVDAATATATDTDTDADAETGAATHLALWSRRFGECSADERLAAVSSASAGELIALCFDPDPRVVRGVLQHPSSGLPHARLVAAHHGTTTGLEGLVARASFMADAQVVRRLLRNPQLGEAQLRRIVDARPLRMVWSFATDRDVGERSRAHLRGLLVQKFTRATPEERVDLVWSTEGRCLALLSGATFDARTAQVLASRTYTSVVLIQNLAKFRATPPMVLTHLLKQPLVRNNPGLRKLVSAHPNAPRERGRR